MTEDEVKAKWIVWETMTHELDWADKIALEICRWEIESTSHVVKDISVALRQAKANGIRELADEIENAQGNRLAFPFTDIPIDLRNRADKIEKSEV